MVKKIYRTLLPIPNVTNLPIVVEVVREYDYFIISAINYSVYGYGPSLKKAIEMLEVDLAMLKNDILEGLVNETNTDPRELAALKVTFGIEEK